jgi:hypothetical protein
VEGHDGHLEEKPPHDERPAEPEQNPLWGLGRGKESGDLGNARRARRAEKQRDAVQEKRRRERAVQEKL